MQISLKHPSEVCILENIVRELFAIVSGRTIKTFLISAEKVTEKVKDQQKKARVITHNVTVYRCETAHVRQALNTSSAQGFYAPHHQ